MPLLADINTLEKRVQSIIQKNEGYRSLDNYRQLFTDAVFRGLGDFTAEQLATVDIDELVRNAIMESEVVLAEDLGQEITSDVESILNDTRSFYDDLGVEMPDLAEAVSRTREIRQLTNTFQGNIHSMEEELRQGTIDVMREALGSGTIDRADIRKEILTLTDAKTAHADTNARLVVSGYNRNARNEMRKSADIGHGFYYGDARHSTRAFCRYCIGKVFSMDQINLLNNGQGLDVLLYCGGWNCIHSWLWLEPEWDDDMMKLYNAQRSAVDLREDYVDITVFP